MPKKESKLELLTRLVSEQEQFINRNGATLAGYVERYGTPGDPRCTGDGGEAIYRADMRALNNLRAKLADESIAARRR